MRRYARVKDIGPFEAITRQRQEHAEFPGQPWQKVRTAYIREETERRFRHRQQRPLSRHSKLSVHRKTATLQANPCVFPFHISRFPLLTPPIVIPSIIAI